MTLIATTLGLALALLAQYRLAHAAPLREVGALFLAAAALAIRYFPDWGSAPAPSAAARAPASAEAGPGIRRWLLAAVWLAQAGALALAATEQGWPWDGLLWGLSLLAFVGARLDRAWWGSLGRLQWGEGLALAGLLAVGLFARAYDLAGLPLAIHGDEAQFGLVARAILYGQQPALFATGWYHFPIASFAAQAGVMRLFGDDIGGLRLSSALVGTLTLLPVYLLARSMFDRRAALAGAALMALGHWPVHFSRLGINNIQSTFFAAWAVYLAWRALRTGHRLDYVLTGLALGLGLYTYYAARLMPFIVGAILVIGRLVDWEIGRLEGWMPGWLEVWKGGRMEGRTAGRIGSLRSTNLPIYQSTNLPIFRPSNLLVLALAGMLAIAPQVVYYVRHPEPLVSRQRGVFLFNNLPHLETVYHSQDWGLILRGQTLKSLLVFNARGDSSGQYGFEEPMLDWLTAGLMVAGLAVSIGRWRRSGYWLLHMWFWPHLLLGSVLTIDAPFVPRLVGLMPVPFIWAGLALGGWWRLASGLRPRAARLGLATVPIVGLLALIGWTNYDAYLNRYIRQRQAFLDSTYAAYMLAGLPSSMQVYLMGAHNIYAGFGTFRFVAPQAVVWDAVNVADWVPLRQSPRAGRQPDPPDALFLLWPAHMDRLPYLRGVYPEGEYRRYLNQYGRLMFATYRVPAQTIRQRQGLALREGLPNPATEERAMTWSGTLWLPDDGPRQFCLPYPPGEAMSGAYLQIDGAQTETPGRDGGCDGLILSGDWPAGPHPVEIGARVRGKAGSLALHWRRGEGDWEEVPRHWLWDTDWPGGLSGVFEGAGGEARRKIAPFIAYRDFDRELAGVVQAAWSGCLAAPAAGEYEFMLRSFDGARLALDNQPLIEDEHRAALGEQVARVQLGAGGHAVQLEALFTDGPRWLEWYWRRPGEDWALVPPQVLWPGGTGYCQR